jgi:hypothetical protein
MDWLTLDSKMLASVAYDAEKQILYLRFRTSDVYRYFDFSGKDYQHFLNAESRGKYFLTHIRDQFRHERMAKLRVAWACQDGLDRTLTARLPPRFLIQSLRSKASPK